MKIEELLNDCIPDFEMPSNVELALSELDGWDSMAAFILIDKMKADYSVSLELDSLGKMTILELSRLIPSV